MCQDKYLNYYDMYTCNTVYLHIMLLSILTPSFRSGEPTIKRKSSSRQSHEAIEIGGSRLFKNRFMERPISCKLK